MRISSYDIWSSYGQLLSANPGENLGPGCCAGMCLQMVSLLQQQIGDPSHNMDTVVAQISSWSQNGMRNLPVGSTQNSQIIALQFVTDQFEVDTMTLGHYYISTTRYHQGLQHIGDHATLIIPTATRYVGGRIIIYDPNYGVFVVDGAADLLSDDGPTVANGIGDLYDTIRDCLTNLGIHNDYNNYVTYRVNHRYLYRLQ